MKAAIRPKDSPPRHDGHHAGEIDAPTAQALFNRRVRGAVVVQFFFTASRTPNWEYRHEAQDHLDAAFESGDTARIAEALGDVARKPELSTVLKAMARCKLHDRVDGSNMNEKRRGGR